MADNNQDVNLRIRATDYSKKTTDEVVKSLKEIAKAQDAQVEAAKKGTAAAKDLTKGYDDLEAAAKALVGQRSLIQLFERQNAALRDTDTLLERARQAQTNYANSMVAGAKMTKEQREQTDRLAKAVRDAQRSYDGIQQSITTTSAKMSKLGIDTTQTTQAQANINQALTGANIAMERQEIALQGLDAAIARNKQKTIDAATAKKNASDAAAAADYRERAAAAAQLQAQEKAIAARAAAATASQREQQQLLADLNTRVRLAQQIASETAARQAQTRAILAAADAAERQARVSGAAARGGPVARQANFAGQIQDIQQPAAAALRTMDGLNASIAQLGTTVAAIRGPIANYRQTLQQATDAQRALVEVAGRIDTFRNQVAAVRAARTEYTQARESVRLLVAELRSGAAGDGIDTRLARAQTTLRGAAAALGNVTTAARASQQALQQAGVNTAQLAQQEQNLVQQTNSATASVNRLTAAYQQYGAQQNRINDGSRQTLSWTQRIRGELLGLASAFVGIYATINLASKSLEAYRTNQAITSRLLIANAGDARAAGEDFKYLQQQADRIGFTFNVIAPAFTKFAIAAKSAGFTTQQTRFVFENIAEAGVKARLSTEELGGVFKAFEQIMSKGTVQAEELRGQLGDRLPGAFQIAARAANMTVQEYSKALELGQIGSEQVIGIARELGKTYGVAAAGADKLLLAQARFDNATNRFLTSTAEGGFVEAYSSFLEKLTALLDSGQGDQLASILSAGFASVINVVITLAENIDLLKAALISLIAVKFIAWLTALPALFTAVSAAVVGPSGAVAAVTAFSGILTTLAGTGVVGFLAAVAGGFAAIAAAGIGAYMATKSIVDYFANKQRAVVQKAIVDSEKAVANAQRAADQRDAARGTAQEAEAQKHYDKMRDIAVSAVKAENKAVAEARAGGLDLKGVRPGQTLSGTPDPGNQEFGLEGITAAAKKQTETMKKLEKERSDALLQGAKKDIKTRLDLVNKTYDAEREAAIKKNGSALELATTLANIEKRAQYDMATERIKFNQEQQKEGESAAAKRVRIALEVKTKLEQAEADIADKRAEREAATVPFEKRAELATDKELAKYIKLQGEIDKLSGAEKERAQIKLDQLRADVAEDTYQKKAREEAVRLEKQLNDLLEIQKAKKEALATQFAGDTVKLLEETNRVTAEMAPAIQKAGQEVLVFVDSVKKLIDPVAYQQLLAKTGKIIQQNSAEALTAQANLEAAQIRMNTLVEQQAAAEALIRQQRSLGLISSEEEAAALNFTAAQFKQNILDSADALLRFAQAARDAGVITADQFQKMKDSVDSVSTGVKNARQAATELDKTIANSILQNGVTAFDALGDSIAKVVLGQQSISEGFRGMLQAAAAFFAGVLKDIATYIIKQQILNAIKSFGGGVGAAAGAIAGAAHNGAVLGHTPPTFSRRVSASVFDGAQKFHNGGLPGLRPDEVPIIAQRGEEVITRDDPRNALNGGASGGGAPAGIRVVVLDDRKDVPQAMSSAEGEAVIMATVKRNIPTLKQWTR